MHYTSYLIAILYSIFLIYKFYPICYDLFLTQELKIPSFRRAYSFMLESSVAFIFTLGFVMMTPQLYINYKLKSVDHLPWRTLVYRFISTIIDDIFVFMVSVPWLQRVFCFRDGNPCPIQTLYLSFTWYKEKCTKLIRTESPWARPLSICRKWIPNTRKLNDHKL